LGGTANLDITVVDDQGNGVPDAEIALAVTRGDGMIATTSLRPNTDGQGRFEAALENASLGTNTVEATVVGASRQTTSEAAPLEATLDVLGEFQLHLNAGLQLFTVPLHLPRPEAAGVLGIPADYLKLATFDAAHDDYVLYSPQTPLDLTLGRGYFVKLDAPRVVGITEGTPEPTRQPLDIAFGPRGWHLLGNPFLDPLVWDVDTIEVVKDGVSRGPLDLWIRGRQSLERAVEPYLWAFDPTDTQDPYYLVFDPDYPDDVPSALRGRLRDPLRVGEGGFALTNAANAGYRFGGNFGAPTSTDGANASPTRALDGHGNWSVELIAQCGDAKDAGNAFGVFSGRAEGFRLAEPPVVDRVDGTFLSLAFMPAGEDSRLRSGTGAPALLAADVRPQIGIAADWQAVVRTNRSAAPVTLSWPDLTAMPGRYRAYLIDTETGAKQAMRTTSSYRFRSEEQGVTERRFRIEVEAGGASRLRITNVAVVPGGRGTGMSVAFILSQPARVRLALKNAAGRSVYVAAPHQSTAGANAVSLTGRSAAGQPLARGVYVLELVAEADTGERFRVLQPAAIR